MTRRAPAALLVGPDAESAGWVRAVARRCGAAWVVGEKHRLGARRVRLALPAASGAVVIDDIASSGATLAATVRALRRAGMAPIDVAVVHAVFAPGALERIRAAGARRVVSCDTIPHPSTAIAVAPLVAAAL